MDPEEATKAVFTRIHTIDPDHASKIMGYILLQDQPEEEMVRIALGSETMLNNVISVAKTQLGISSNTLYASTVAASASPLVVGSGSVAISRPNPVEIAVNSPRMGAAGFGLSSPSSPVMWAAKGTTNPLSYAAVVNGSNGLSNGSFSNSPISSPRLPFGSINGESEFNLHENGVPVSVQSKSLDFGGENVDLGVNGEMGSPHFHRRSCSVNDMCFDGDESCYGFVGFKPCMYFQRGFCKNGSGCKFVHGDENGENGFGEHDGVVSPCKFESFEPCHGGDVIRSRVAVAAQQQRFAAAQLMNGVNFPYNKLNFLNTDAQRSAAAALIMRDEFHKLNRCRIGRNEFTGGGGGDVSPGSRQIYLTFPADSTFREEDVSNYFRIYGPVQDVRIPYQQKRMFGFVTFVYPETVKLILAKGNPHFVCDSRVLVKPYKEKGKLPDKKQLQHQFERNEFSAGLDHREPFDIPLGPRMMYNATQEMIWKRKLEQQAGLQHALELQSRRLMNLKLMDLKSQYHPLHNNIPFGSPFRFPHLNVIHPSNGLKQDPLQEDVGSSTATTPDGQLLEEVNAAAAIDGTAKETNSINDECDLPESFEHILPDNLFTSPTKSAGEKRSIFSPSPFDIDAAHMSTIANTTNDSLMAAASTLSKAPLNSCFLEMPRFTPGHGAIGM